MKNVKTSPTNLNFVESGAPKKDTPNPYNHPLVQAILDFEKFSLEYQDLAKFKDLFAELKDMINHNSDLREKSRQYWNQHQYPDHVITFRKDVLFNECPEIFKLGFVEQSILTLLAKCVRSSSAYVVFHYKDIAEILNMNDRQKRKIRTYFDNLVKTKCLKAIYVPEPKSSRPAVYLINKNLSKVGRDPEQGFDTLDMSCLNANDTNGEKTEENAYKSVKSVTVVDHKSIDCWEIKKDITSEGKSVKEFGKLLKEAINESKTRKTTNRKAPGSSMPEEDPWATNESSTPKEDPSHDNFSKCTSKKQDISRKKKTASRNKRTVQLSHAQEDEISERFLNASSEEEEAMFENVLTTEEESLFTAPSQ